MCQENHVGLDEWGLEWESESNIHHPVPIYFSTSLTPGKTEFYQRFIKAIECNRN